MVHTVTGGLDAILHAHSTGHVMIRFPPSLRRQSSALLLGGCAAALVSLPPIDIAGRLDARQFDLWTRLAAPVAPDDIVIVDLDTPVSLDLLADESLHENSLLLVSTLPEPPTPRVNEVSLGPTEITIGGRLLERTDWLHGGHLSFEPDVDGRVRSLTPYLLADGMLPSLAVTAVRALDPDAAIPDAKSRLNFLRPDSLMRFTSQEIRENPGAVSDRIIVAGPNEPYHETPVGRLTDQELLAQVIAGYRAASLIGTHTIASALPWLIAVLVLGHAALRQQSVVKHAWLRPLMVVLALTGLSGLCLVFLSIWIPITAPSVTVLITGSLLYVRPQTVQPQERSARRMTDIAAHEALADGRIEEAWEHIDRIPPGHASLEILYEFADALEQHGYADLATHTFHRAALIDPRYRDVARRLVRVKLQYDPDYDPEQPLADRRIPRKLGRYELLEPVGSGSTGTVYLAIDPSINRLVALKVINLKADYDPDSLAEAKERFWREAESAGRLSHPNIVTIHDIGESRGMAYIAMEYLKGRHLSDFTRTETLLPAPLVLELGAQVAEALAYAHANNVVHRDIKPGNIMYDSVSAALTITDFGIARLMDVSRTRTGVVLGTPSFMAPEQLEGKNVNRHTDLFALGVSLYELLTGRLPFLGTSMTKLMFVIANEPHEPITAFRQDLSASVDSLMDVALAKCPEDRFTTGVQMAAALRRVAGELA